MKINMIDNNNLTMCWVSPSVNTKDSFVRPEAHSPPFLFKNFLPLFLISVILTTCTTLSPVSAEKEQPAVFSLIEDVKPQWLLFTDGIGYFHGKIFSPRLEFYALKIDLFAPNVGIVVKAGANNGDLGTKVSSFVRDNNLVAGINAVPFDIITSVEGQPIQNMGIIISDGILLSPANRHYDALVFYDVQNQDNEENSAPVRAAIVSQSSIHQSTQSIKNAVGGFHQILTDGEPAQRTLNNESRHPRSAAGICEDGRFLFLLVIDGRRANSAGSTENETALLLQAFGSHNGINFDGGGSSALVMRYPDGETRVVNTPIHGMIPGQERAVAGCLGISLK